MNVLHMKYAVEVADAGSINKASETLLIAPPNLSRSIRELEGDLGISIFERSSKGMSLTDDGQEFIRYARKALQQIDEIERIYKSEKPLQQRFSISIPRSSYISYAFAHFSRNMDLSPLQAYYNETNSTDTIKNVLSGEYALGVIRYGVNYDRYFSDMMKEKGIHCQEITQFPYVLLMNNVCDLASLPEIHLWDLRTKIEIAQGDPLAPSLPFVLAESDQPTVETQRRIFLFDRASQFDLLSYNPDTFMWVSPLPQDLLDRYGLLQRVCPDNHLIYKDVLIRKNSYRLTELDHLFIEELYKFRPQIFS